ncbi:MAG: VWA domain-containing protein [Blastocatellia bacterium]|nr:VWA domain-containing protein [Blastocatellia bacterium]
MKATYALSHPSIPIGSSSYVDLLVRFKAESELLSSSVRRPLNLSLVIDRSGSMAGVLLKHAIRAANALVDKLSPADILSVVVYDDNVDTIVPPEKVSDRTKIHEAINKIRAGGCTNLSGGWKTGCDHVKAEISTETINRVLLLTDGQANVGTTDPASLIKIARETAEKGIITTTLGFGSYFNEDLLIGIANASHGNFYYIQSPDEATEVFAIELESVASIAAQNLVVTIKPKSSVQIEGVLNNYKSESSAEGIVVSVGDIYSVEDKLLALELQVCPETAAQNRIELLDLCYKFCSVIDGAIKEQEGILAVEIEACNQEASVSLDASVLEQTNRLRVAKAKDEAINLTDKGDYEAASKRLRKTISDVKLRTLQETYEVAEELDHLDHYAQKIEKGGLDSISRKEMRDQSFQAQARNRNDLKLRGVASGSSYGLAVVNDYDQGVILKCVREGGKLRMKVVSEGYNHDLNVQFPRHLREEGVTYIVDQVAESADGSFYKVSGNIRRLLMPGETVQPPGGTRTARSNPPKPSKAPATVADLETTTSVGDGVLVQCVKDGSKLRARVVSDGYNPNHNMRFPRSIREEGTLYVVEEVIEGPGGTSYIACGKIKKLLH